MDFIPSNLLVNRDISKRLYPTPLSYTDDIMDKMTVDQLKALKLNLLGDSLGVVTKKEFLIAIKTLQANSMPPCGFTEAQLDAMSVPQLRVIKQFFKLDPLGDIDKKAFIKSILAIQALTVRQRILLGTIYTIQKLETMPTNELERIKSEIGLDSLGVLARNEILAAILAIQHGDPPLSPFSECQLSNMGVPELRVLKTCLGLDTFDQIQLKDVRAATTALQTATPKQIVYDNNQLETMDVPTLKALKTRLGMHGLGDLDKGEFIAGAMALQAVRMRRTPFINYSHAQLNSMRITDLKTLKTWLGLGCLGELEKRQFLPVVLAIQLVTNPVTSEPHPITPPTPRSVQATASQQYSAGELSEMRYADLLILAEKLAISDARHLERAEVENTVMAVQASLSDSSRPSNVRAEPQREEAESSATAAATPQGVEEEKKVEPSEVIKAAAPDPVTSSIGKLFKKASTKRKGPECKICFEPMGDGTDKSIAVAACGHSSCYDCMMDVAMTSGKCFMCRSPITANEIRKIYLEF